MVEEPVKNIKHFLLGFNLFLKKTKKQCFAIAKYQNE